jgi:hypothetical protein
MTHLIGNPCKARHHCLTSTVFHDPYLHKSSMVKRFDMKFLLLLLVSLAASVSLPSDVRRIYQNSTRSDVAWVESHKRVAEELADREVLQRTRDPQHEQGLADVSERVETQTNVAQSPIVRLLRYWPLHQATVPERELLRSEPDIEIEMDGNFTVTPPERPASAPPRVRSNGAPLREGAWGE